MAIVFHMMPPLSPLNPHLESPLSSPMERLRSLAEEEMVRCKELNVDEGFLLKNLEKDCKHSNICNSLSFDFVNLLKVLKY